MNRITKNLLRLSVFTLSQYLLWSMQSTYLAGCECGGGGNNNLPRAACTTEVFDPANPTDKVKTCCNASASPAYATYLSEVHTKPDLCKKCDPNCSSSVVPVKNLTSLNNELGKNFNNLTGLMGGNGKSDIKPTGDQNSMDLAKGSAATMGEMLTSLTGLTPDKGASGNTNTGLTNDPTKTTGRGGGSGLPSQGATHDLLGEGDGTTAIPSGKNDPSSAAATGLTYSSGGGTGKGSTQRGGSGFGGASLSGLSGGSVGSAVFGAQDGGSEVPIEDPADYFTRIALDESLFKIVHQVYRIKEGNWLKEGGK